MVEISNSPNVPRASVEAFLDDLSEYVVLRNFDVVAHLEGGGDLDLLVADLQQTKQALVDHLGPPLWITRRSYVHSYFYPWGHIDLTWICSWRGAEYISAETLLAARRRMDSGVMKPRLAHEALVSWLTKLLYGGFFKKRYRSTVLRAVRDDAEAFQEILVRAAGEPWGQRLWRLAAEARPEASEEHTGAIRRAVWVQSLRRNPYKTIQGWLAHWRTEVRLRLHPPLPWIVLLGPAGRKRSSVLELLEQRLHRASISTLRASPSGRLAERIGTLPTRLSGGESESGSPALARLILSADEAVEYWTHRIHQRAKNRLFISEAGTPSLNAGAQLRNRQHRRHRQPAEGLSWMVPAPDLAILLDLSASTLPKHRPEVPAKQAAGWQQPYRAEARGSPATCVLDATRPVQEVVDAAEQVVLACIAARQPLPAGAQTNV